MPPESSFITNDISPPQSHFVLEEKLLKQVLDVTFLQNNRLFTSFNPSLFYFHGGKSEQVPPLPIPITHVIFDCDGILIGINRLVPKFLLDSGPVYERALCTMLNDRFKVNSPYESSFYWNCLSGTSDDSFFQLIFNKFPDLVQHFPPEPDLWQKYFMDIFDECVDAPENKYLITPIKGVLRMLEQLSTKGIPMNIATNSTRAEFNSKVVKNELSYDLRHNLMRYFKESKTMCVDDVLAKGFKGKPDPHIYWEAAKQIGVCDDSQRSKCLVFEDSWTGVQAALNAGMRVIWMVDKSHLDSTRKVMADGLVLERLSKHHIGQLFIHVSDHLFEDLVLDGIYSFDI